MKDKVKSGRIYLVNFSPSAGHEYQGMRPAVVIQSQNSLSKERNLVTIVPISSRINQKRDPDILVRASRLNMLHSDSIIKVSNIVSFDTKRFIKEIGRLEDNYIAEVSFYIRTHFGLD